MPLCLSSKKKKEDGTAVCAYMLTQARSNVISNSSSSLDGEQERHQRYTETQLSNLLNVGVRKGESLGIRLGHGVNQ